MLASRHYSIQFMLALSRLSLLALTRAILQDKLFCAARTDEANTRVMRMTDPWWVAGMHFDKMLKKHEQLVQVSFICTTKSIVGPLRLRIWLQQPRLSKLRGHTVFSMQDLKHYEALMAVRMQYCETEVLPQRALPIPAWASNTLQQVYMSKLLHI